MAYLFDKPDFSLTEELCKEIELDFKEQLQKEENQNRAFLDFEKEVDEGIVGAIYTLETKRIDVSLYWADRDGGEGETELESWTLE